MSRIHRVLVALVLALGLTLAGVAPTSALTIEEAGPYYLTQVCAPNPYIDAVNRAVFRGKNFVRPRQMHGKRLRQTRRALLRLQRREVTSGSNLLSPPSAWPSPEVGQSVAAMGRGLLTDARLIVQLRKRAGRRFLAYWDNVWLPYGDTLVQLDEAATDALGLTPDNSGC